MNDTLRCGHVETLYSQAECLRVFSGSDGVVGVLDSGSQLALDCLVAIGGLGIGENSLLLALNVCHFGNLDFRGRQ